MTERELLIAYVSYDMDELAAAFAPLTEAERKHLRAVLSEFFRNGIYSDASKLPPLYLHDDYAWLQPYIKENRKDSFSYIDALMGLALGKLDDVKMIWMHNFSGERAASLIRVMRDRRPAWAQKWLEQELKRGGASWEIMQELIACGVWQRREGPDYYRCMSSGLAGLAHRRANVDPKSEGISDYLREHPEFLALVYELFSIEAGSFLNSKDQWQGDARWPGETWAQALKRLSDEGLLERLRLLRLSLVGLLLDFKAQRLTGLADFHEGMDPSVDELAALQSEYLALLAAERDSVAAFGIKMLGKVEKAKLLDDGAYVSAAVAVLDRKGKGMAKTVLTQFQKIGKRSPTLLCAILSAAAHRGLAHGEADVKEASLRLLEGWKAALDVATREAIGARIDDLPLTMQARARALADVEAAVVVNEPSAVERKKRKAPKPSVEIPAQWRSLAGVDAAEAAIEEGKMPPPFGFEVSDIPVLSGVNPIAAVASMDELFDLVSRCVMGKFSAMDLERMLDGISRMDRATSKDFARLAAPLAARLAPYPVRRDSVEECLRYWLTGDASTVGVLIEDYYRSNPPDAESSIEDFQRERVFEIGRRLVRGVHAPMLSLPTHEGGWITAGALVARLQEWQSLGLVPEKFDLIQALLRLAPEGREAAARELGKADSQWSRAIRWTLTGEGRAEKGDDPDVWLAASRSRMPRESVTVPGIEKLKLPPATVLSESGVDRKYFAEWLASLRTTVLRAHKGGDKSDGHAIPGPDGGVPGIFTIIPTEMWQKAVVVREASDEAARLARYAKEGIAAELSRSFFDLNFETRRIVPGIERLQDQASHRFGIRVTPTWTEGCGVVSRPTVLLQKFANVKYDRRQEAVELDWAAMCWPHNLDAFFASGLVNISLTFDWKTTKVWPEYAFLSPLFDVERPVSMPAAMLICLGLCAPQGDLSRTAIDVLAECIGDGRAHPDTFDEPVARIAHTKWFQYGRFVANLGEVARVSPMHAWVVAVVLERHFAGWKELPKNGLHALELLAELLTQLGLGLGVGTREALGNVKAGGKSGKLVKQLLGMAAKENGAMDGVREALLGVRIARAERWADKM